MSQASVAREGQYHAYTSREYGRRLGSFEVCEHLYAAFTMVRGPRLPQQSLARAKTSKEISPSLPSERFANENRAPEPWPLRLLRGLGNWRGAKKEPRNLSSQGTRRTGWTRRVVAVGPYYV